LDTENAEEVCQFEPADFLTAETIFDARWATALLHETMARLGNQYAAQGKSATLQALEPFLAPGGVQGVPSYEQAADQFRSASSRSRHLSTGCETSLLPFYVRRSLARCQIQRKSTRITIRFAKHWLRPKDGWVHESGEHAHLLGLRQWVFWRTEILSGLYA
jgi:hypothetical protein